MCNVYRVLKVQFKIEIKKYLIFCACFLGTQIFHVLFLLLFIVDSDIKYTFSMSDQQTKWSMHYLSLSSVLRHLALIEGVITLPLTYPMGC